MLVTSPPPFYRDFFAAHGESLGLDIHRDPQFSIVNRDGMRSPRDARRQSIPTPTWVPPFVHRYRGPAFVHALPHSSFFKKYRRFNSDADPPLLPQVPTASGQVPPPSFVGNGLSAMLFLAVVCFFPPSTSEERSQLNTSLLSYPRSGQGIFMPSFFGI